MPRKKKVDENDPMVVLARVALQEQADKAEERENKRRSRELALRQQEETENDKNEKARRFQALCDHLLGNHRIGVVPNIRRCALHKHQLSNKQTYIYCGKCRFEWKPGDRPDYIIRVDGEGPKKLPNPTKKGWKAINEFFYTFDNANDLTSRAFRVERIEPEQFNEDDAVPEQLPA